MNGSSRTSSLQTPLRGRTPIGSGNSPYTAKLTPPSVVFSSSAEGSLLRESVARNNLLSVVAPASNGELIYLPQIVTDLGRRCYVAVPQRRLAQALAKYSSSCSSARNNKVCANYTALSSVTYLTTGQMINILLEEIKNNLQEKFSIILYHRDGGTIENYTLLTLWRELYTRKTPISMIVVSSFRLNFPFTVQPETYLIRGPKNDPFLGYSQNNYSLSDWSVYSETALVVSSLVEKYYGNTFGDILVFAAGPNEVSKIGRLLQKQPFCKLFLFVGDEPAAALQYLHQPYERKAGDPLRVIVICEYLETTITIPDFLAVVDTMRQYSLRTELGGPRNVLRYISQECAQTRATRTSGVCWRMISEEGYQQLPVKTSLVIEENPVYNSLLAIWSVTNANPPRLLKVSAEESTRQWQILIRQGLVEENGQRVSSLGFFARRLPLSLRHCGFLWEWKKRGVDIYGGIVLVSLLDSLGPTFYNGNVAADLFGYTELEILLRTWAKFSSSCLSKSNLPGKPATINVSQKSVFAFAQENNVNPVKLQEVVTCVRKCLLELSLVNQEVSLDDFSLEVISSARVFLSSIYHRYSLLSSGHYLRDDGEAVTLSKLIQGQLVSSAPRNLIGLDQENVIYVCLDPLDTDRPPLKSLTVEIKNQKKKKNN